MSIFTSTMSYFPLLFTFIIAGLIGIILFALVVRVLHPEIQRSIKTKTFQQQYWRKQLRRWGIDLKQSAEEFGLQEVEQSWKTLHAIPGQILLQLLILLSMILVIWNIPLLSFYLIMSALFACLLIIRGWSYTTGFIRLRTKANSRLTYSDLRQRRLSDYRWSPFRWLIISTVAFATVVTLIALPYFPATLSAHIPGGLSLSLFQGKWILIGMNLTMLVICTSAELLAYYVATFSRLLVTSNPTIARQVDDMFRSKAICELQGDEFTAIAYLCIIQFTLLVFAPFDPSPVYLHPFFWLGLVLAALLYVSGLASYGLNGRLGGSISHWPWQQEVQA